MVTSVIIDEIDAICKPRGKTDQSAAGAAYDALVNQLLTLMDGLNNLLVVGGLPDEEGRQEISEIHTGSMAASGMLGPDVNSQILANYVPQGFLPCGATHGGVVDDGSGKTSYLALLGKFSHVKVDHLHQAFEDASKSPSAVIMLDDFH
eukprot:Em0044g4a